MREIAIIGRTGIQCIQRLDRTSKDKAKSWEIDRSTMDFKTVIKKINSRKDEEIAEGLVC